MVTEDRCGEVTLRELKLKNVPTSRGVKPTPHAHWMLGGLIAFYLVIALMDHPYRGELGLSPDAFQLIYHQVMQQ